MNTGDTVEVEGHTVNTAANGQWQAVSSGASALTLVGSTGNGVGGATGQVLDYEVLPALTLPANTELADMGPLNAAIEGVANPIPFLYRLTGKYRLYNTYPTQHAEPTFTGGSAWSPTLALTTAYQPVNNGSNLLSFGLIPAVALIGDYLDIDVQVTARSTDASNPVSNVAYALALGISINGGGITAMSGSDIAFEENLSTGQAPLRPLRIRHDIAPFGIAQSTFQIALLAKRLAGGGGSATTSILFEGSYNVICRHYRPN
jgi:hypothetical protein